VCSKRIPLTPAHREREELAGEGEASERSDGVGSGREEAAGAGSRNHSSKISFKKKKKLKDIEASRVKKYCWTDSVCFSLSLPTKDSHGWQVSLNHTAMAVSHWKKCVKTSAQNYF